MAIMEWQPIETLPDEFRKGQPVFMLPRGSDDPVVAEYRNGDWLPVSDGRRVVEHMSDFGTTYAELCPEYWCFVPNLHDIRR